jgi:hypothetical protein
MLLALSVAVFFFAMGLVALVAPARILETFGVAVGTPEGRTEVRAVYGGFGIAISGLLLAAVSVDDIRTGAYVAVAVAVLGMAAGRVVSALLGERTDLWPTWVFCALELAMGGMLVGALVV